MIERQIDRPMPIPLGLVVKKALKSRSTSPGSIPTPEVLHRDEHLIGVVTGDRIQLARPVGDGRHGFHAVHRPD